jgi:RimJ/RimL family protein N-acetyltransferase
VHWVITEYGTAYLFGRSPAERAVALIEIAHPDDREYVLDAAYGEEMAFAPVVGSSERERIVAAGSYYLSPATGLAEVAYMVDPEWQGAGLAGLLHARMLEYAREHGVRGFRADVMMGNSRMMRVFKRAGHEMRVKS